MAKERDVDKYGRGAGCSLGEHFVVQRKQPENIAGRCHYHVSHNFDGDWVEYPRTMHKIIARSWLIQGKDAECAPRLTAPFLIPKMQSET